MSTAVAIGCGGCARAERLAAKTGVARRCLVCDAERLAPVDFARDRRYDADTLPGFLPPAPPAPDPAEDAGSLGWAWRPRAAADMRALARHPAISAVDVGRAHRPREGREETDPDARRARERRQEIDRRRAYHGRARLAEMHARGPLGRRYAQLLWETLGAQGEDQHVRASPALYAAQRFGESREKAAFRAACVAANPRLKAGLLDAFVQRAYGVALADAATAAYEDDAWAQVADPETVPALAAPPPAPSESRAQRHARAMADNLARYRAEQAAATGKAKTPRGATRKARRAARKTT
jgi:hypothetical protein